MRTLAAVDLSVPVMGIVLTAALLVAGSLSLASGCLAGAVLASLEWFLIRFLYGRLVRKGGVGNLEKLASGAIIGFKFIMLAFLIYMVINRLKFNPCGVAVGVGSLPLGIIVGVVFSMRLEGGESGDKGA